MERGSLRHITRLIQRISDERRREGIRETSEEKGERRERGQRIEEGVEWSEERGEMREER